jgi:Ca2+-binding RTX toxin-like protein
MTDFNGYDPSGAETAGDLAGALGSVAQMLSNSSDARVRAAGLMLGPIAQSAGFSANIAEGSLSGLSGYETAGKIIGSTLATAAVPMAIFATVEGAFLFAGLVGISPLGAGLLLLGAAYVAGKGGELIGGWIGKEIGELLPEATSWITDIFGPLFTNHDPLIFDLNHDGVILTSLNHSNVLFDLDSDGVKERTAWISSKDGFLSLDVNQNGLIDNGSELFGTSTSDGFSVLAQSDVNADGRIDASDLIFANLRLWKDENSDGISQPSELITMSQAGVLSIDLHALSNGWQSREGNLIVSQGKYKDTIGINHEVIATAFSTDLVNTTIAFPTDGVDPEVFFLPNLRGYGQVADLWTAMTLDPQLKEMVKNFINNLPDDFRSFVGYDRVVKDYLIDIEITEEARLAHFYESSGFEAIIARWAGVDTERDYWGIYPIAPVTNHNDEIVSVIGQFTGRPVATQNAPKIIDIVAGSGSGGGGGSSVSPAINPVFSNSELINAYQTFTARLAAQFLVQLADIESNKAILDLVDAAAAATNNGEYELSQAEIADFISNAVVGAENSSPISSLLEKFSEFNFDFSRDIVTGDISSYIDSELDSYSVVSTDPWQGYAEWWGDHRFIINALDPQNLIFDERFRAHTGNEALPINRSNEFTLVSGASGEDVLIGDLGDYDDDLIVGGAGNDVLEGGLGDDAYVFRDGFGNDTVSDSAGNADEIAFQQALTEARAHLAFEGSGRTGLVISFDGTADTVTVAAYLDSFGNPSIERITFGDGVTLSPSEVLSKLMRGLATSGADTIIALAIGSDVYGEAGNDILHGNVGNDVLIGGVGDDTLWETQGDDTYVWNLGDGADIIRGPVIFDGVNVLRLGPGISASDLRYAYYQGATGLTIEIAGPSESISISNTLTSPADQGIDRIIFDDGTVLERQEYMDAAFAQFASETDDEVFGGGGDDKIFGMDGDDTITPRGGNDTIVGGSGDDLIYESYGNDSYLWNIGDGDDTITPGSFWDDFNTVQFGPAITLADLRVTASGHDIVLSITGHAGSITLQEGLYGGTTDGIDRLRFDDGTLVSRRQIVDMAIAAQMTSGNDVITVPIIGGVINAGNGDDIIYSRGGGLGAGEATISGGSGDDLIYEGSGNDIYLWSAGDGDDIIRGGSFTDDFNILKFGVGLLSIDLEVAPTGDGKGLRLAFSGRPGSVTLESQLIIGGGDGIDEIHFADGTIWDRATIMSASNGAQSTGGDDTIVGSQTNDVLLGGAGDDSFDPRMGNDLVIGGLGDDLIQESEGDDAYLWNVGDGHDTITAGGFWDGFNTVQFGLGIAVADLRVAAQQVGMRHDIIFVIAGEPGSIRLINGFSANAGDGIDQLRFDDGTVLSHAQFMALLQDGASLNLPEGIVTGTSGAETVTGSPQDDIIQGGAGDDRLEGEAGSDTYRYASGDGNDLIVDIGLASDLDSLELTDLNPNDVELRRSDDQFWIRDLSSGHEIRILHQFYATGEWGLDQIVFADDSVLSREQIRTAAWYRGGVTNDALYGSTLDDTLVGNAGNDWLEGNTGSDSYRYASGDGSDTIFEFGASSDVDTLLLIDRDADDVELRRSGDGLWIRDLATGQEIQVSNQFNSSGQWGIEQIEFSDGDKVTREQIRAAAWYRGNITNDALYGSTLDDALVGNAGNDWLEGNTGSDIYRYASGDGSDTIFEFGASSDVDTLLLVDIDVANVELRRSGDGLWIRDLATGQEIQVSNQFHTSGQWGIEQILFSDGTTIDRAQIQAAAWFRGTSSNDSLSGTDQGDILVGGFGSDTLSGGAGSDAYRYISGDGNDTIVDYGAGLDMDSLRLTDLNAADVELRRSGDALWLRDLATGQEIQIQNQFNASGQWGIEQIQFSDGTALNRTQIKEVAWFRGTSGADTIYGTDQSDVLAGGLGDDVVSGGAGGDTYKFNLGDGQDTIREAGSSYDQNFDLLEFGAGIAPGDLRISISGDDLIITIVNTTDRIKIDYTVNYADWRVDQLTFADGTIWSFADMVSKLVGTSGNDTLVGTDGDNTLFGEADNDIIDGKRGDDIIVGGTGNDILSGSAGSDTYRFNLGDGQDIIRDAGSSWDQSTDILEFGAGIAVSDLLVSISGNDLILGIANTTDSIKIDYTVNYADWRVDEFHFASGAILTHADVMNLA